MRGIITYNGKGRTEKGAISPSVWFIKDKGMVMYSSLCFVNIGLTIINEGKGRKERAYYANNNTP